MQQTSSAKAFHQSTEAIWIFHVDFNKFQESWKHRSIAFQRDNFVCDEKQRAHISRGHIIGWGRGRRKKKKNDMSLTFMKCITILFFISSAANESGKKLDNSSLHDFMRSFSFFYLHIHSLIIVGVWVFVFIIFRVSHFDGIETIHLHDSASLNLLSRVQSYSSRVVRWRRAKHNPILNRNNIMQIAQINL